MKKSHDDVRKFIISKEYRKRRISSMWFDSLVTDVARESFSAGLKEGRKISTRVYPLRSEIDRLKIDNSAMEDLMPKEK